ncbi:putative glycosyl transferase [Actinacidiphila reveromycinica]|uniref:Putative glycosyl transferase n=1 Tax=Actinacidiphila reveromycinica TaxID=659352 RepID=A0A7U3URQ1_9ACTN|nr:glycosyltransferase family 2 protein [Streptomyces sp. SN-593]BBA97396.1 putative glycosyl transferase [Streptomyces sp. SN-593]
MVISGAPRLADKRTFGDVWLIIPVYNEAPVVAGVVAEALRTFPNVVCVDDGSADGSPAEIVGSGAHLVQHPVNLGQGAAIQTGLHYALSQPGAERFVTFDADGQHRVEDVITMLALARARGADVVLGSRFLRPGGERVHVPWTKRLVLRTAAAVSPTARRLRLSDAHNGLRLFNRVAAARVNITMNGMAHASEITGFLARSDLTVVESPVSIRYTDYSRAKGQSLLNGVNILFDLSLNRGKG